MSEVPCECGNVYGNCWCASYPREAWALVERNGQRTRVCDRCDLSTDKVIEAPLGTPVMRREMEE